MSATYDPTLPTPKDVVRWLTCDTDVDPETDASVSDEEIEALLELFGPKPACVAAEILSKLLAKFTVRGMKSGIVEKQVSRLRIRFGTSQSTAELLTDRLKTLRRQCARDALPAFTALGPSKNCCHRHRRFWFG